MQLYAILLGNSPWLGDAFVRIRLMDNLRYKLRSLIDKRGRWSRYLGASDGILTTINYEEGQQGPDLVHKKADAGKVDEKEDG